MGSTLEDTSDKLEQRPTHTTTAEDTVHNKTTPEPVATSYQPLNLRELAKDNDEVDVIPINNHGALENGLIVQNILSHLRSDPWTMYKLLLVSRTFRDAGMKFLWHRSDTANLITYVHDASRREKLARWIEHVVFFNNEVMWPTQDYNCPELPRVSTAHLVPFLGPSLHELSIWTQSDEADQPITRQGDDVWVSRLRTACSQLSVLNLEAILAISSAELASLFRAVTQVERLRLGYELNSVLEADSISAIFALPKLKQFSMDFPLNAVLVQELLSASSKMLPSIKRLDITFEINDSLAAAILLENIGSVEELSITFTPTGEDLVAALHSAFFEVIGFLPRLRYLGLYLPAAIIVPCHGLAAVAAKANLHHFVISSNQEAYTESHGYIFVTERDLVSIPFSPRFLDALESLNVASPIQATYDEATAIIHKIKEISPDHMRLFDIEVDEGYSSGWPSAEDYELCWEESDRADVDHEPNEMIWKASGKAFAPDPVQWSSRNLNNYTDKHGKALPIGRVATKGDYNHLD